MKFVVDNQLPGALSAFLASRGYDCVHIMEIGLGAAIDSDIWQYARDSGRIVISKDEDFVHLANRQPPTGRVIWVRLGNCRTARLITEFEGLWPRIQAAVEAGDRVIEIR